MMADCPIIFSAPMVRALMDGRKTQTRRFPRVRGHKSISEFGASDTAGYDWHFRDEAKRWHDLRHAELIPRLPYAVGDRLYVRENLIDCTECGYRNHAEGANSAGAGDAKACANCDEVLPKRMVPCIHMPRVNSRITLIVTDVRVQRLQDIDAKDACAEGVMTLRPNGGMTPRALFIDLWKSLHGPEAWDANPWVAAYTFTAQMGNIDRLGE